MAQDKQSLYLIGIGGTGARCVEAIINIASVGLLERHRIKIVFVDADETNGNLDKAKTRLSNYTRCHKYLFQASDRCSWMSSQLDLLGNWSPFSKGKPKRLEDLFQYNNLKKQDEGLSNLFDVLYTKAERTEYLEDGFLGRPAVGAAFMSKLNMEGGSDRVWADLVEQVKNEASGSSSQVPKILLCGSIFGGTGASGIPTIGRLLQNLLGSAIRKKVKVGSILMLPYFGFPSPEEDLEIYAKTDHLLLNSDGALRYYSTQSEIFDSIYLLGNTSFLTVQEFHLGRGEQKNPSHFVELYSALAARHFMQQDIEESEPGKVHLISRKSDQKLKWDDIPEMDKVQTEIANAVRFCYVWLETLCPRFEEAQMNSEILYHATWLNKFFRTRGIRTKGQDLPSFDDPHEVELRRNIQEWCQGFLMWTKDIHQQTNKVMSSTDNIELLRCQNFESQSSRGEYLSELVWDDQRARDVRRRTDTVTQILNSVRGRDVDEPNKGTAGLARAVYILSRIEVS